jgi:integrase
MVQYTPGRRKPLKLTEILSEAEVLDIIKATKKINHALAYALAFYGCMRISEIVKLQPDDINWSLKLIHIKQAKGSKDRMIPIPPEAYKKLKTNLPIGIGARALEKSFKKIVMQVLKKDMHFHLLRHSGISYYLNKRGLNAFDVQRMAGHSRITTTQIYAHVNPEDLVNKLWN